MTTTAVVATNEEKKISHLRLYVCTYLVHHRARTSLRKIYETMRKVI